MKKNTTLYLLSWVIALAVFNVIAFAVPSLPNVNKYTASFWIGYSLITVSFVCQLFIAISCMSEEKINKKFYNIPVSAISYAGLIASFVVGGACMALYFIPDWVGAVVCVIILGGNVISLLGATAVSDAIAGVDKKVKVQTFFIKSLTVDADTLMAKAKSDEARSECRRVYEAIRYSDPMSNDALSSVEAQITLKFAQLSEAVSADDSAKISETAGELIILVNDRNNKCKLLK